MSSCSPMKPDDASELASPIFVQVADPSDKSWRSAVRSRAASARHAAARRQRLLKHQREVEKTVVGASLDKLQLVRGPQGLLRIRAVEPFDSLARPTSRFECFLMDHYIKRFVTYATFGNDAEVEVMGSTGTNLGWVHLGITEPGFLNAVFLSTCRHLVELGAPGDYYTWALEYRDRCIRSVKAAISQEMLAPSIATIITTMALALDARKFGNFEVAKDHCRAISVMIRLRNSSQAPGMLQLPNPIIAWVDTITNRIQSQPGNPPPHMLALEHTDKVRGIGI
ncbi:hypothetical protein BKA67DRAFT_541618 [Truncatella angustata]|uniref:Uncharacterized protein n=1 Tax=Truncatella angustata TaxID=152316 RepID=A0A9P8UB11_9PEZI|nr:uncharacterized protein BKA67DRAFT_541618 [Truncatella angustata]KAH6645392.1 hypothetical protein BKA67DRAFT_541618 [Truncatella angustata]